jgi:DNA-binding CsgD family transcriptional regulator
MQEKKTKKQTKKQLIKEVEDLKKQLARCKQEGLNKTESSCLKGQDDIMGCLAERIKELNCLYRLFNLAEKTDISLEEILAKTVGLLAQSWQYADITCARICRGDKEFKTSNFKETAWKQAAELKVFGKKAGVVEVFYLKEKPFSYEGPFLKEERALINSVTQLLGDIVERKTIEGSLKKSEARLREQNLALEQKNIALREVIAQIEVEKNKIKEDIKYNLEWSVFPVIEKLKLKKNTEKYIELLLCQLKELTSSFGFEVTNKKVKLTHREIEICNMIKGNLTTKEIAGLLNVSPQTIEKHRKNIRKKLNLSRKKPNLAYFLHQL